MEPVVAMSEGEWSSLSGTCSTEEANFMAQLFGTCPNEQLPSSGLPIFWTNHESNIGGTSEVSIFSSQDTNSSIYHFSTSTNNFQPMLLRNNNTSLMTMEQSSHLPPTNILIEADAVEFLNKQVSNDSIESGENIMSESVLHGKSLQLGREYDQMQQSESSKKRSRSPVDHKNKRSVKPKKNMKSSVADDEETAGNNNNNTVLHRQSSFSCCSEDESNVSSYDLYGLASSDNNSKGVSLPNGKSRANRGSATDPQSLYARKRRERINERLRILQSLVPNGTKVDISTMLEEAVQYVKFLQLQIKLLSSDDLWMYSPIAYNGMDIGLDLKIGIPNPKS